MNFQVWLYDYFSGEGIRQETMIGKPSITWDYEGENTGDITIKAPTIEDFESQYEPYKHGIAIVGVTTGGAIQKVLLSGPITKSLISMENSTISLAIGSTLDYFKNVFVYPYAAVSDSDDVFRIPSGTTEVEAARRLLRYPWEEGAPSNSSNPKAPTTISISTLSNSSQYTLSDNYDTAYSDGMSVYDALEDLKGLRQGIEIREDHTATPVIVGGVQKYNFTTSLTVYNRFGDNKTFLPSRTLPISDILSYEISEEPYTFSRVIAVSRDSDKEEKINSDLQHRIKPSEPLLLDIFESLQEEATSSEMDAVLDSRLFNEKYSSSIYEISIYDGREDEKAAMEAWMGAILSSTAKRLGSKSRVIGITHVVGTTKYDLEITTDWSTLVYPQPSRKKRKEDAEKREKERKQKNQRPRKGNTWDPKPPWGGKWGEDFTPTPTPTPTPDPTPTPPDGQIPNPDGELPLPDPNDSLGDGYKAEGDTIWRITEKKTIPPLSIPDHQRSIRYRNTSYSVLDHGDINEKGELFVPAFMTGAQNTAPQDYTDLSSNNWMDSLSLNAFDRTQSFAPVDRALHYDWTDLNIGPFSIIKYSPEDGELGAPEVLHEGLNITGETMEMLGEWKPAETFRYNNGEVINAGWAGVRMGKIVVVGQTVFIPILHSVAFPDTGSSRRSTFNEMKFLVIDKDGKQSKGNLHLFAGRRRSGGLDYQPFPYPPEGAILGNPLRSVVFNDWAHRQAMGGYKTAKINTEETFTGSNHRLVDMFSGATRYFDQLKIGDFGVWGSTHANNNIAWGSGYLSQPMLSSRGVGELYFSAVGKNQELNAYRIISAPINGKSPLPSPPWSLERGYQQQANPAAATFQIRGNLFFRAGALDKYHYYDARNKFVSALYDGVGTITNHTSFSFSKGDWLYTFNRSGSSYSYKIEPYNAGELYPERGGSDKDDLFVYYDFGMLHIKTPDHMMAPLSEKTILKVWQEGGSEMSTDKYQPLGKYAFRFAENGFTEDTETFIEWQVWAANQKYNQDEEGNEAPAYAVRVSLTPNDDEDIETSGTPTIIDNYRGGQGWD